MPDHSHGSCPGRTRRLWTFPRVAWERELLPGAQVLIAPPSSWPGVGETTHRVDSWRGSGPSTDMAMQAVGMDPCHVGDGDVLGW